MRVEFSSSKLEIDESPLSFADQLLAQTSTKHCLEVELANLRALDDAISCLQCIIRDAPLVDVEGGLLRARLSMRPSVTRTHPIVLSVRRHLSRTRGFAFDEKMTKLKTEVLNKTNATRLGLTVEEMNAADGFAAWAHGGTYLNNRLARYDDYLAFDKSDRLHIKYQGVLTPWDDIPKELLTCEYPSCTPLAPLIVHHGYGCYGVMKGNVLDWSTHDDKLFPMFIETKHELALRGGGCAVSVRTSTFATHQRIASGDHTWLALHNSNGEVYVVGKYRPRKREGETNVSGLLLSDHMRVKVGTVIDDWSEFWDDPITSLTFAISEKAFFSLKQQIEEDHKRPLPFHLTVDNCSMYVINLLRVHTGIDMTRSFSSGEDMIDSAEFDADSMFPPKTHAILQLQHPENIPLSPFMGFSEAVFGDHLCSRNQRLYHLLPQTWRRIPDMMCRMAWHTLSIALGASKIEPELSAEGFEAPIKGLRDVLRLREVHTVVASPWSIGQRITPAVLAAQKSSGRLLIPRAWIMKDSDHRVAYGLKSSRPSLAGS